MKVISGITQKGFTIVELLIVIVVIAILAAISIVAYNGIQARATDTSIRSAASQLEKAIRRFAIETDQQPWSGSQSTGPISGTTCPSSTVASGFAGRPTYQCTLEDQLVAGGQISSNFFSSLPPNKISANLSARTFMFYQCGANNRYGLYWYLNSPSTEDSNSVDATIATCGHAASLRDTNGMRAGKIIQL